MEVIDPLEQEFLDELDLVADLVRNIEGWNEFVRVVESNRLIHELFEDFNLDFSLEQVAILLFWRMCSFEITEDHKIANEFDGSNPDGDDGVSLMLFSLRVWKDEEVIKNFICSDDVSFVGMANLMEDYALQSRVEAEEMSIIETWDDPIEPLPDEDVDSILRRRRGEGLSNGSIPSVSN